MRNKRHKYPVFLAKVSKIFETSLIKKGAMKKVQKYGKSKAAGVDQGDGEKLDD